MPVVRGSTLPCLVAALFCLSPSLAGAASPPSLLGGVQGEHGAKNTADLSVRSFQVAPAPLQPLVPPVTTASEPDGVLRLWMDNFPDLRVPMGAVARLHASASKSGYLMLWTMSEAGEVLPIADGAVAGRDIVAVGPDRDAVLPGNAQFELVACPPTGPSVWFALHSDTPIPEAARARLARELEGARVSKADGAARFRKVLDAVIADTPGWRARSYTVFYQITPGTVDTRCKVEGAASSAPAPMPPPTPSPTPVPTPAPAPPLPPLPPSVRPVRVDLDSRAYYAQVQPMRITVYPPETCPGLTVLALGAGGAVDVLLPNAETRAQIPLADAPFAVPMIGGSLALHVRTPPVAGVAERVVALCDPRSSQPLFRRDDSDGPTVTLRPTDPRFAALARTLTEALRSGRLLVGVAEYTNLGDK